MDESLEWDHLGSRQGEALALFGLRFDEMRHPVSGRVFERMVLESVDWVNCVAVDTEGRHVMIRQFRFGVGYTTLETPGGMVDEGEDSGTAARHHLCHHWLATGVDPLGPTDQGAGEHIRVELMDADSVVAAAHRGEIKHALALSVIGRVLPLWEPRPFSG